MYEGRVRAIKQDLKARRRDSKATLKDIQTVLIWHNLKKHGHGDAPQALQDVFNTRLYINHGAEYCEMLSIINEA